MSQLCLPSFTVLCLAAVVSSLPLEGPLSSFRFGKSTAARRQHASRVFGISEWRDKMFDFPGSTDETSLQASQDAPLKEICILPFPYDQVLLQGETKQLRLYEERFITLFDDAMENHEGVVAMGLIAEAGIIQTVPVCEIEASNRMDGFGIFVTIRVVGRAKLLDVTKQEPYLKAVCVEFSDKIPPNLELPCIVANNIENFMLVLSTMEHQLEEAISKAEDSLEEDEEKMRRRINVAKLEDRFYADDDEEGNSGSEKDRRNRYQQAYQVALATDTQGYCAPSQNVAQFTIPELSAISWAAFCTEILSETDATSRVQALDCEDLFDRLKLASQMLRGKKEFLQKRLKKAGITFRNEDKENEDEN